MGVDIERIVEKDTVIDHLICSICMDVLENPKQAPCQHSFCNTCIREWLDNGNHTCPVDRQDLSIQDLNQPRLLQEILNKLTIRCKNHEKGCSLMAKYADQPQLIEHETENCSVLNNSFRNDIDKLKKNLKALEKKISEKDKIIFEKEQENTKLKSANEKKVKMLKEEISSKNEKIKMLESSYQESRMGECSATFPSCNLANNRYMELPKEILEANLNFIAFGPNQSWIALFKDDSIHSHGIKWSTSIPHKIFNLLKGRYSPKQNNLPIVLLYYDNETFVTLFSDGSFRYSGSDLEFKELLEDAIGIPSHLAISFSGSKYIMDRGGFSCWKNIPSEMQQLIQDKSDCQISWTALGNRKNSYYILFEDGNHFWNNLPEKLEDILRNTRNNIKRVCLSQFDDRFLVMYEDDSLECY